MEKQRLLYLLSAHATGHLTEEERHELAAYVMDPAMSDELAVMMEQAPAEPVDAGEEWKSLLIAVMNTDKAREEAPIPLRRVPSFFRRWGWAAVLIPVLVTIGIYVQRSGRKDRVQSHIQAKAADIAPGRNGAVLTLADGSQVVLDSMGNRIIATQKGAQVLLKAGRLSYMPLRPGEGVDYNRITTAKGRQFKLVLPDGTGVWLNAASSLRYPTSFAGKTRQVEVTGEAYFEVAENANMPFHVNVNGHINIEVLGTHFNVNAYEDEQHVNTTLVEGRIKVSTGTSVILEPGEQAQTDHQSVTAIKAVSNADIEKVTAWKDGLFNFNGATLHEVMRQLERWYDIEVIYEKGAPDIIFWGKMTKDISLNGLLIGLEKSGVHLRQEGRKLFVLP